MKALLLIGGTVVAILVDQYFNHGLLTGELLAQLHALGAHIASLGDGVSHWVYG